MDYRLTILRPWRYRDHKRNFRDLQPGDYSVPEHVTLAAAQLAVAQGMGRMYRVQMPFVSARALDVAADTPEEPSQRRKTRAPRNKARGAAPENKAAMG